MTKQTRAPRWYGPLVPWGAQLLTLAVIEVALSVVISGSAVNDRQLPLVTRISLAALDIAALATTLTLVHLVARAFVTGIRPFAPWLFETSGRWFRRGVVYLAAAIAVLLYMSSWALFWNTGVFVDQRTFAFLSPHSLQVFHWVYPPLAAAVVLVTLVVTSALVHWIPRRAAGFSELTQERLVLSALSIAAAGAVIGAAALIDTPPASRHGPSQPQSVFSLARNDRTSPLLHAVASATPTRAGMPDTPSSTTASDRRVIRRPIITMDEYVSRVAPGKARRWNIVMVQIESLRSDQLRIYGGPREVMPTVDRLALESRVFTNAYVQASHSNYADLVALSSHYPLRSPEMYVYPPNPPYPRVLIYDILKALGYRTAIFSSQNERWGGMINYHRPSSLDKFFHAETFDGPTYAPFGDTGFAEWVRLTGSAGSVDDRYTVGEAIKWIASLGDQPFFIHMNLQSSHVPYVVPPDFPHKFGPKTIDFPIMWGRFPLDKLAIVKDRYADSLFYEDAQITRLFAYLKKHNLWERTIIIVGGDNGEAFYEHGIAAHASTLYNEVIKVPMLIKAPEVQPRLDDRPAMFLDLPPSILDLLGLPPHPSFQGISLFEDHPNPNRSLYSIVQTPLAFQSALIRSGFKLLYSEWERRYYLWDLVRDAAEQFNIAESRPDIVQEMAGTLQIWRTEQLAYYSNLARQGAEYPPVIAEQD